jgi:valyl-tRNA synthetase
VVPVGGVPVTVLAPGGAENLRPRLEQELAKAEAEIERARRKLADARFVERAPAQLVQEERDKLERFEREAAELRERIADLGA